MGVMEPRPEIGRIRTPLLGVIRSQPDRQYPAYRLPLALFFHDAYFHGIGLQWRRYPSFARRRLLAAEEVAYATDKDRRHALRRTGGDHCRGTRMPCADAWRGPGEGAGRGGALSRPTGV